LGWGSGSDDVTKKPKTTPNMTSPTKNLKTKFNNFSVQNKRLSESLDSSLPQSAGELWNLAKMSKYAVPFVGIFSFY